MKERRAERKEIYREMKEAGWMGVVQEEEECSKESRSQYYVIIERKIFMFNSSIILMSIYFIMIDNCAVTK